MIKWCGVVGSIFLLSACMSTVDNPDEDIRAQAWSQVNHITDVTDMGGNRLRVTASTAPGYGINYLESDLLARAAGEAVRRSADRFSIVFIDYNDSGVGSILGGQSYGDGTRAWIGTYEDLVAARNDSDLDGSLDRDLRFKEVTAVVRLLAPGEMEDRQTFDAEDTYISLISDRIERRNIKPRRFITFRR